MTYSVWREGYVITGGSDEASLMGHSQGDSFKQACDRMFEGDKYYNSERLTYWGCHLYDNSYDAQRSFG